jgi:hypothetical protein
VFGFLLLAAGAVGGGALYVLSTQRHDQTVEDFARAAVGCTTMLEFGETGTFYVYEESGNPDVATTAACEPVANQGPFAFELTGPAAIAPREDTTIAYAVDGVAGTSVARFTIATLGQYQIEVRGPDVRRVAAIGRDPNEGVDRLRRGAFVVGGVGIVLGALLLALAGWRSKRASTPVIPDGPGWGTRPGTGAAAWPPEPPRIPQVPVNPHQPDQPAHVAPPPPPLPSRTNPGSTLPPRSPWAAPSASDAVGDAPPPVRQPPPFTPAPNPTLPDSGTAGSESATDDA